MLESFNADICSVDGTNIVNWKITFVNRRVKYSIDGHSQICSTAMFNSQRDPEGFFHAG